MFWIMLIVGFLGMAASAYFYFLFREYSKIAIIAFVISLVITIGSFFTASGAVYRVRLLSGTVSGYWLIIDQNGGKVMRHWVLKTYPKDADNSDGTQFVTSHGLVSVGTGATIIQIDAPLKEFYKDYKKIYGIPEEQKPLK